MQVPVHDLDGVFHTTNPSLIYVSTAQQKIRVYDVRQNSKPCQDHELTKYEVSPLNNIILSHSTNFCYVSNMLGSIYLLDARQSTRFRLAPVNLSRLPDDR